MFKVLVAATLLLLATVTSGAQAKPINGTSLTRRQSDSVRTPHERYVPEPPTFER